MIEQMEQFDEGGLRDEGGQVEPKSGNKVPSGSLKEEVADDIPVMMSEGEFVFPADVVRYIGLETLMKMRQDAKQGLKMMEEMGQMGNSEEATIPDDMPFEMADLIVVSGGKSKKMQTGGLLDDPRFKRPESGGGTPTITDEDRKEMEDALLRTGFGSVVMKRYVNANGDVKYIPFINGEPQMEIPEGYELDESAPKTQANIGGSGDSGGGGDSGGPALAAPAFGDGMTFEKPKLMVDGVGYDSIEDMKDPEVLLKYYEQFNSPIYRYAATFATLLFSPLVGGAIAIGQSLSNKNSPNGLNAVQQKLMTMKLTKEQRARAKIVFDNIKKNGAGGLSSLTKPITNALGITSDKKKGEKETDFEKFLRTGNAKGAVKQFEKATVDPNKVKTIIDNAEKSYDKYLAESGVEDALQTSQQPVTTTEPTSGLQTKTDPVTGEVVEGDPFAPTETLRSEVEQIEPTSALQTKIDPVTGQVTEGDPFAPIERAKPAGDYDLPESIIPPVDEEEEKEARERRLGRRLTKDQFVPDYGFDRVDQIMAQQKRTDDRRTLGDKVFGPKKKLGVEQSDKVIQTPAYTSGDDDRDDGGTSSAIDDFFGSDFGQPSQPTYISQTAKAAGSAKTGLGASASRPQTLGVSAPAPKQAPTYDYDQAGPFYVGGVATKPMKPQRLKKGGLAKMKVKPKRMKKGGLASRKK